ncbi:exotoxin beta-grasp domain-containing protein [Staphylococcus hyicus]|uniref:exotoxin beta-grasp domain-containing protein n=1 Tax=Staphylococcus hyicus TaxID=1284 RepID=UPI0027385587|nr:superantigen-like protein [Staphylococcus hyicus]MDP4460585.1 superantigen-like protein [Staphylococcus hyicus]MDY3697404.1 superantigen-like protein [Staphylococcus hyicus]
MKLSTIAKSSLALGILTTGIITTHAQSANAAESFNSGVHIINNDTASLHSYYQQAYYEFNNVSGTKNGKSLVVKNGNQTIDITIPESAQQFQNGQVSNIDVFAVKEYNDTKLPSIGGITQNTKPLKDGPITPKISLRKSNDTGIFTDDVHLSIEKQNVSLKELDFKLRQQLVEHDGLYANGYKRGNIFIRMKDNVRHDIDLSDKLPVSQMGTVIDATQIDHIHVEMKS